MSDVTGVDDVTLKSRVRSWTRQFGHGYEEVWEGPNLAAAKAKYDSFVGNDAIDKLTLNTDHGKGVINVLIADDDGEGGGQTTEVLDSSWELVGRDLEKPLRSHGTFNKDADQAALAKVLAEYEKGNNEYAPDAGVALKYLQLLQRGAESYLRSTATLQKRLRVGTRSDIVASWAGVDEAWPTDGGAGSPGPPTRLIGSFVELPGYRSDGKHWLKRAPGLRQITRWDYEIIYQWYYSEYWSFILYEGDVADGNP